MVKIAIATVVLCFCSSVAAPLPPTAKAEVAVGVVEGFVSDNYDLTACGINLGVGVFKELGDAGKELMHGFSHLNMTEIEAAIDEFHDAVKEIPDAKEKCSKVLHDLEAIMSKIRELELHGPEKAVDHILDNMFGDGDKIFGEMSKMANSMKDGVYMDAGMHMGMALRRTLVGESAPNPPNGSTPLPPAPKGTWKLVGVGAVIGFVSDDWSFLACSAGAKDVFSALPEAAKDLMHGLRHFNMTEVTAGITAVQDAISAVPGAETTCKAMLHDVEATIDVIKQFRGVKDLIDHVIDNMFSDAEQIFGELAQMETDGKDSDYINAGVQMGSALRRMLVGEPAPSATIVVV